MVRGVVAPYANSFYGEHRYVSFLFPLLAIFFVIGWEGISKGSKETASRASLRKWLFYLGGVALIFTVVFYLNPLVRRDEILRFLSGYFFPSVLNFANFKFIFSFTLLLVAAMSLLGTAKFLVVNPVGKKVMYVLVTAGVILQMGFLINRGQRYALSVKNINEMQVHLGKWMNQNIPEGSLVAINDVGAIKFFGNRTCLDLEGLVSPQIIPYKILGENPYILYFNKNRPDYFITFPIWYLSMYQYLNLWGHVLYQVNLKDNVACGAVQKVVAQPDWEVFDSTFQNTGLLDLKPHIPKKTFKRRWYDAEERQALPADWRVYQLMGRDSWKTRNLDQAEGFYQKAESYDPQNSEFYLHVASFYQEKGDQARAEQAYRKSIQYQLFPPPEYGPVIGR